MSDTPDLARVIAENVYAAFCRQATMPAHPLEEPPILTRLVEAIRPQIGSGSPEAIIDAANAALSPGGSESQKFGAVAASQSIRSMAR